MALGVGVLRCPPAQEVHRHRDRLGAHIGVADRRAQGGIARQLEQPRDRASVKEAGPPEDIVVERHDQPRPAAILHNAKPQQFAIAREFVHRSGYTPTCRDRHTRLAADLWSVNLDANQTENAILNLVVNARDAMPDGGRLTNATYNRTDDGENGDQVIIEVADDGVGMSEETVAQVFDPFFTTKPVGQGTGLGLSQVYGFIKQSHGTVSVDSRPGEGTRVRIALPRAMA